MAFVPFRLFGFVNNQRQEFISAIGAHQAAFGLDMPGETIERLADFFRLVQENNALLHLVAPCSAEEFAIRHLLEPLMLLEYLSTDAAFADVGTGAGIPAIPCLLARSDLSAMLIESKERKADYLEQVVEQLGLGNRAKIFARQFSEADLSGYSTVTSRALDRFSERLPRLIKWAGKRRLVLFGGPGLRDALAAKRVKFSEKHIPLSDQRFIFRI
jgi:16S rRNA (guanine527-N7)-methyltransferase